MKIAFITNVPDSIGRVRLAEEAESRGHQFTLLSWQAVEITESFLSSVVENLSQYDVVHFAGGFGEFITQELQLRLSGRGVFCPNSFINRSLNSENKLYQALQFTKAGLPTPKSVRSYHHDYDQLAKILGNVFVAKTPNGMQGKGVSLIGSKEELESLCESKTEYLFQEFIDYVSDYRVHVIGDVTFCAYRRIAPRGDFRANVSLGGSLEKITDVNKIEKISVLARKTCQAMRLDYCGVDIIEDKQGNHYLLETNYDPGYKEVEEITGMSFADPIVDFYEMNSR
jgi:RimK family alpha-L-glutamate ligase